MTIYNVTYDTPDGPRFYTSHIRRAWVSKYRRHVGKKQLAKQSK